MSVMDITHHRVIAQSSIRCRKCLKDLICERKTRLTIIDLHESSGPETEHVLLEEYNIPTRIMAV